MREANRFIHKPVITSAAALIFQWEIGSSKTNVEAVNPNIGTNNVNGATVATGYRLNNQLHVENPIKVDG